MSARGHVPTSVQNEIDKKVSAAEVKQAETRSKRDLATVNLRRKLDQLNEAFDNWRYPTETDKELADRIRNEDQERAREEAKEQARKEAEQYLAKLETEKQKLSEMELDPNTSADEITAQKAKVENADSYASKAAAMQNPGGEGTKETMDDAINAAEQEKRRANAFGNGTSSAVQEIYHNNNDRGSTMGTDEQNKQVLASRADNGQNPLQNKNKFQGALDTVTGAATNAANTAMQNPGKVAAGAGILMAANLFLRHVLGGTVFNAATSIGKFRSGNEMLNSPKLNQNLAKIARKYQKPYPTTEEVKADPKAKSKETFMAWLLSGQTGNQRISNQIGSSGTLVKTSQLGIPVAITTLSPAKTQALQQLGGNKIAIATAFFRKNGQIVSEPVARGFLAKGSVVNASLEAADIFFNARGQKFNKAQIKYLADKSYESFGPNPDFEAKIIDWYCL